MTREPAASPKGTAWGSILITERRWPTANSPLRAGSNRAELSFTHAMHRLRIELSGDEQVLSVELRSRMKGSLELLTGGLTPADEFG